MRISTSFWSSLALSLPCRREDAALRLMLERREAELREAMKLHHGLTTLLHALRLDMEHVSKRRIFSTKESELIKKGWL